MKMNGLKIRAAAFLTVLVIIAGVLAVLTEHSRATTVNGTLVKYNRLQFIYSTVTSGNSTTISWELWCTRTNSNYNTYKKSTPTTVVINGQTAASLNTYYDVRSGSKMLCSGTKSITRSNGAAMTVPFSASVNLSGTSVGSLSVSGNISLQAYTVGGKTVTANIDWIDNENADGARPETVTLILYQNGNVYKEQEVAADQRSFTFGDLPAASGGASYTYTVGGREVENYAVSEPTGETVTYTYNIVPEMGFRMGFSI